MPAWLTWRPAICSDMTPLPCVHSPRRRPALGTAPKCLPNKYTLTNALLTKRVHTNKCLLTKGGGPSPVTCTPTPCITQY